MISLQHAHAPEQGDILERARDPQLGPLVRFQARDVAAVEHDPSAGGRVDAADAIEDAGLAGAVGADDGEELAGVDLEAHPGQGGHAAEAQAQVFQSEKCHSPVTPLVIAAARGSKLRSGGTPPDVAVPGGWAETVTASRAFVRRRGLGHLRGALPPAPLADSRGRRSRRSAPPPTTSCGSRRSDRPSPPPRGYGTPYRIQY